MIAKSAEEEVLSVEDDYAAAEVKRDEPALRRLIDENFVHNRSDGTTGSKDDLIQGVLQTNMVGQTLRERTVLIEGEIALIFGTTDLRFKDPGKPEVLSSLRYTAIYIKRNGQWRMLALQMQQRVG